MSKDNKTILIKAEDIENYEIDEAANDYPMLTKEEHNRLVEDIKANGQLQPVVIFKNKIVDAKEAKMYGVKILGGGKLTKKLKISVPISKSAAKEVENV